MSRNRYTVILLVRRNLIDQLNQNIEPAASCSRYGNHFSAVFERLSSMSLSSSIKVLTSLNWR